MLTRLGRDMAGPWARRQHALHAELRAVYFGRAIPGDHGCVTDHGIACLRDGTYTALRGGDDGITAGVDAKAAKALLKVGPRLARVRDRVGSVFPELVAATRAIERLRGDELPEGFEAFDRIVVDELQDLTLLETAVVVELCGAIARARGRALCGRAPWLLMAGDAGQTVRPTGFEWAPLNDLLALRLRRPEKFRLDEHLRCPSRIAEVVERASRRYADIEKEVRPTSQHRQPAGRRARRCAPRPRARLRAGRGGPAVGVARRDGRCGGRLAAERPARLGAGRTAWRRAHAGGDQGAGVPVGLRPRSGPPAFSPEAGEPVVRDRRGARSAGAPDGHRPSARDVEPRDGDAGVRGRRGRRRRSAPEPGAPWRCGAIQRGKIYSIISPIPMRPRKSGCRRGRTTPGP